MNPQTTIERRYDIDWLRNLGILLLFPFHSARVFDYWDPFYVKNEVLSWGASWFIACTSYWFMPLLFWLAGSASWYALRFRSGGEYVKDRFSRLLIPLLVGTLLIIPPQGYYARMMHAGESGNYFVFLHKFFTDFSDLSGYFGTFTPAHLWFILYLFIFSVAALPLFQYWMKDSVQEKLAKTAQVLSHPAAFLLLVIPLTATQALPAPGGQNIAYYLFIFAAGFLACTDPRYQQMFNRIRFKALLAIIILVPLALMLMYNNQGAADFSAISILLAFMRTLNMWLTLIVILGYGNKFLNVKHKLLPYLNEAAFPVYILHQSVLVVLGFYIVQFNVGVFPKYIAIMVSTIVVSYLIYEFLIKRTAITRALFGVKVKKSNPAATPPMPPSNTLRT
jgi:hypothetical protein